MSNNTVVLYVIFFFRKKKTLNNKMASDVNSGIRVYTCSTETKIQHTYVVNKLLGNLLFLQWLLQCTFIKRDNAFTTMKKKYVSCIHCVHGNIHPGFFPFISSWLSAGEFNIIKKNSIYIFYIKSILIQLCLGRFKINFKTVYMCTKAKH